MTDYLEIIKRLLQNRYLQISVLFIAMGAVLIYQLANLQIVNGETYTEQAQHSLPRENSIPAARGDIMDRFGVPIATNRQGFTVEIVDVGTKTADLNVMLLNLIKLLEANGDDYLQNFPIDINPFRFTGSYAQKEDGSTPQLQLNWKKRYNIDAAATAEETFKAFRSKKQYNIPETFTDEEAWKVINMRYEMSERGFKSYAPLTLATDIHNTTVAQIEERHLQFPGVSTNVVPMRRYIDATGIAHILGYVKSINADELKAYKDKGVEYDVNAIIGKMGIEKQMEDSLKGTDGLRKLEVDTKGRFFREVESIPAVPGNNVVLTLDMKLQNVAMKSLEATIKKIQSEPDYKTNFGDARTGAAVAIDVNTGEVLAMVSYPTYDPSLFLGDRNDPDSRAKLKEILNVDNKDAPLLNRAIQGRYAPGSTFKMCTAVAALEEGVTTTTEPVIDLGEYEFYDIRPKCWIYTPNHNTHGAVNVSDAIRVSCNYYFYEMGKRLGITRLDKWATQFGLGQKTGVDLPSESAGALAGPEYARKVNQDWTDGLTLYTAIGQSYNAFTPLQMANYVATIANGGKRYQPYVVKKVIDSKGSVVKENKPVVVQDVKLKPETVQAILNGMIGVTTETGGTAVDIFKDFPKTIAGKTGTAQGARNDESNVGVFVGFAPAEKPEIAVVVVVDHGVHGSSVAPVAKDIFTEYFKLNRTASETSQLLPDESRLSR